MTTEDVSIVDLFCGCGGFSLGAELAGCKPMVSIDIDPILQSSYRKNFPKVNSIQASVSDLDASAWRVFLGKKKPDGVIGGPPCQGFSRIGRRAKDDPRNTLVYHFYRNIKILRPKFFVMENVQGLLDKSNESTLQEAICQISGVYRVLDPIVVNAAHFGAPTTRLRVVVVGYDPREVDMLSWSDIIPSPPFDFVSVKDAISDLPKPIPETKNSSDFGWALYPLGEESMLSRYARKLRAAPSIGVGSLEAIARLKAGYVSGLFVTRHSDKVRERYGAVPVGKSDLVSKSYRLDWHGLCPTLRAGTGVDKGAFQAVRPIHPEEARVITVREAARLQGFPDWFVFHPTKWHSFRMIGNSVSPEVSFGIMSKIAFKVANSIAA